MAHVVTLLASLAAAMASDPSRPRPTESRLVRVEPDVRLFVERFGTGTPTVFIPNRLELVHAFRPLLERHDVVTWDPRGRGLSDRPEGPERYGIDAELADAEALRRHFGADRVVYAGISLWGNLAVLYAARHPDSVSGAVALGPLAIAKSLVRPSAKRPTPDLRLERRALARMAADGTSASDPYAYCVLKQYVEYADAYVDPAAMAPMLAANLCQYPNEHEHRRALVVEGMFRSFGTWDWRVDAETVEAPVLVLFGEHEQWRTDGVRAYADHLRQVRWLEVPRAGHHVWNDRADVVIPMLDAFFGGHWPEGVNRAR